MECPKSDRILEHKTILKYKKVEITSCISLDHSGIKLGINNKGNYRKYSNMWRLKTSLLNDQWVTEEISKKKKNPRIK
jgi:hypothetical protein